jgi:hypothetical protein
VRRQGISLATALVETCAMDLLRRLWRAETVEQMRERLLAETSAYVTECLRHPELAVRIPIIRADSGRFPRSLSTAFWDPVLLD